MGIFSLPYANRLKKKKFPIPACPLVFTISANAITIRVVAQSKNTQRYSSLPLFPQIASYFVHMLPLLFLKIKIVIYNNDNVLITQTMPFYSFSQKFLKASIHNQNI